MLVVLLLAVIAAPAVLFAAPAHADSEDRGITRYHVHAEVDGDGLMDVLIDFDADFGDEPSPGPYLTFDTRQEIANDPDHYRVLEYSGFSAESDSGASAELNVEESSTEVTVEIGEDDGEFTGVQSYQLSFQIAGVPTSGVGTRGEDEVYWNAIGSGFEVPLADVRVVMDAPEAPNQAACFVGRVGSTRTCGSYSISGTAVEFRQQSLEPGQGMSVVTDYAPDTFGGVQPILTERRTFTNSTGITTLAAPVAAGLAVLGLAGVVVVGRRRGRDQQYLGLTPGLFPSSVDPAAVGPAQRGPIAVQFTPPPDVRPGEMGTLADEVADPHDVTATIVDLAVRGFIRIEEVPDGEEVPGEDDSPQEAPDGEEAPAEGGALAQVPDGDEARAGDAGDAGDDEDEPHVWQLVRDEDHRGFDDPELVQYEVDVLRTLFPGSKRSIRLDGVKGKFAEAFTQVQADLYDEVVNRGWFAASPQAVRYRWYGYGFLIAVAGVAATIALAFTAGYAVLGVPLVLIGIAVMIAGKYAPARTPEGTAVMAQSMGFKKYLETAEANQIRFEEGEDIFSRYLPFAIAFELTDRWAEVFGDLAAQGRELPEPSWYAGSALAHGYWAANMGHTMQNFSAASDNAVQGVATGAGSSTYSGGSGFSGGFAGGGVGGGGGGFR